MNKQIFIGIGAGLTAALVYTSAATLSPLAVILFYLGPLPVFLAAMGWGKATGIVAGVTAGVIIAAVQSPATAGLFLASVVLPALFLSYLACLGRQGAGGTMQWYPVGRLLLWAASISAVATIMTTMLLGIGNEEISAVVGQVIKQLVAANPELAQNQAALDAMADGVARVIVPMSSVSWAMALIFNLWLSGRILLYSERLTREWPNLHHVNAPPRLYLALAVALGLTFAPAGMLTFIAAVAVACIVLVYFFTGLSVIHYLVRDQPSRPLVLGAVYLVLVFLGAPLGLLPQLTVAGIGLAEAVFGVRARVARTRGDPPPPLTG